MAQKRTKRANGTGSIVMYKKDKYRVRVMVEKDGEKSDITKWY